VILWGWVQYVKDSVAIIRPMCPSKGIPKNGWDRILYADEKQNYWT
jgi:hypothetical protein